MKLKDQTFEVASQEYFSITACSCCGNMSCILSLSSCADGESQGKYGWLAYGACCTWCTPHFPDGWRVVCLVCRAGESMADGKIQKHNLQNCASYSTFAKAVFRPHGIHFISLTVLCDPEISDGHQSWDERRACCLCSQTPMTPK